MTLVEVMVALVLMGAVMTVITTGTVQVLRAANRTESLAIAQAQLHVTFQRLDKEVRYARWIREPVAAASHWYVEFLGATVQARQPRCSRLTLSRGSGGGILQIVHWVPRTQPPPGQAIASQVVTTDDVTTSAPAFTVHDIGSHPYAEATGAAGGSFAPHHQRLRVRLTTRVGTGANSSTTSSDVTFTALNSTRTTTTGTECTEGRPQ